MLLRVDAGVILLQPRASHVRSIKVSKEVEAFKRATEAYVNKATSSAKAANEALVRIGTHDVKGRLTPPYR